MGRIPEENRLGLGGGKGDTLDLAEPAQLPKASFQLAPNGPSFKERLPHFHQDPTTPSCELRPGRLGVWENFPGKRREGRS